MMYKLLLLAITLIFSGCAPRYTTQYQYLPPTQPNGQQCVNQCMLAQQECQNNCQKQRQYCLEDAYGKARQIEQDELRAYDMAYLRYQMEFLQFRQYQSLWERDYYNSRRDFDYFQARCQGGDTQACWRYNELKRSMGRLNFQRPREPWMPSRPDFSQILRRQQSFCMSDCGCERNYNNCFSGCGGVVVPHQVCVENCD